MATKKLDSIDVQDISITDRKTRRQTKTRVISGGPYHTKYRESFPKYDKAVSESVYEGENNSFIILGRDRPYSLGSGKGAVGGRCGRIHMIAGLAASSKISRDKDSVTGPNLISDAATLYISQRTDVDSFFGLPEGSGMSSDDRSAVALKADQIRIIGREHIKIYAGPCLAPEIGKEKNSFGGEIPQRGRIDLIADDYKGLQPAVKGQNLLEYLQKIVTYIRKLGAEVDGLNDKIRAMSVVLSTHTHRTPRGTRIALPSLVLNGLNASSLPESILREIRTLINNINGKIDDFNYIKDDLIIQGSKFILSDSVYIT
jgi:hypothetical protein